MHLLKARKEFGVRRILSAILMLSAVLLCFNGCVPKRLKFMHDTSEITHAEIVFYTYDCEKATSKTQTLSHIDNLDSFLSRLSGIKYRNILLLSQEAMDDNGIAIKLSYENGDHEIFNEHSRAAYDSASSSVDYMARTYSFKSDEFWELLIDYLPSGTISYPFMHSAEDVSRIDFVTGIGTRFDVHSTKVICSIENPAEFIRDIESIEYIYNSYEEQKIAQSGAHNGKYFKITYENGDFELLNRLAIIQVCNANNNHISYLYVGRFNSDGYAELVNKYVKQ